MSPPWLSATSACCTVVDLSHHEPSGIVHPSHEITSVSSANETTVGGAVQRRREGFGIESRDDVVHREGRPVSSAELRQLATQLIGRAVPRAEAAELAVLGDRSDQRGRREDAHSRLDDRKLDPNEIAQGRTHGRTSMVRSLPPTYGIGGRAFSEAPQSSARGRGAGGRRGSAEGDEHGRRRGDDRRLAGEKPGDEALGERTPSSLARSCLVASSANPVGGISSIMVAARSWPIRSSEPEEELVTLVLGDRHGRPP